MPSHLLPYLSLDLFDELGVGNWPSEEQRQFLERVGEVVHLRFIKKTLEILSEEQKIRLEMLLSQTVVSDEAMATFFQMEVPDYENMVTQIVAEYKKELVDKYQEMAKIGE